jgi:hypothetical protein
MSELEPKIVDYNKMSPEIPENNEKIIKSRLFAKLEAYWDKYFCFKDMLPRLNREKSSQIKT